jgi:hypothetical protein
VGTAAAKVPQGLKPNKHAHLNAGLKACSTAGLAVKSTWFVVGDINALE